MLDLGRDVRPAPASVDFVEQRAGWVLEPGAARVLRLQEVAFEAGPALERIVVPAAAGEVLVAMEVAVREDIESRALLVREDHCERVLKLLPEPNIEHAGVERLAPHARVEP